MPMELHTKEGLNRALKHLENADPYKAHDELLVLLRHKQHGACFYRKLL